MAIKAEKYSMPVQAARERISNFNEVALGYTEEIAVAEAHRCLNCKNSPCVQGCPVKISIPDFISKVKQKDFEGAYNIISESSSLPAVCGRVCPQETQCESKCTLGIKFQPVAIGRLERFVADFHNANFSGECIHTEPNGHRVAVVGSGPAGLTCAGYLAKKGYDVTVFEALHVAGGVLVYGIPEFRLPKDIVNKEVESLKKYGVEIKTNVVIGKTLTVTELFDDGYEAVFIGSGAGLPKFMGIPGENLKGVYSANEYLTRVNLMKAYKANAHTPIMRAKNVAVVGGGNVAMDAARTALRLGAENVYIIYRRSMEELPARREEVDHAIEEGVKFELLRNPVEIIGHNFPDDPRNPSNGFVKGIKIRKCELGEPDEGGRRRPVEIPGSEYIINVDCVIMAIGTAPNPLIKNTTDGLKVNSRGGIIVEEDTGKTSKEGVYAGGDAVTGAATVILAMGAGKTAAQSIEKFICSNKHKIKKPEENTFMETTIQEFFEEVESINIYRDGSITRCLPVQMGYKLVLNGFKNMLVNARQMPAFGVSLDKDTRKAMNEGTWVEFEFGKVFYFSEMSFEKLLVEVVPERSGFNLVRYNSKDGYAGRCYYYDLDGSMTEFYEIVQSVN